jgi:hypothetical protein
MMSARAVRKKQRVVMAKESEAWNFLDGGAVVKN